MSTCSAARPHTRGTRRAPEAPRGLSPIAEDSAAAATSWGPAGRPGTSSPCWCRSHGWTWSPGHCRHRRRRRALSRQRPLMRCRGARHRGRRRRWRRPPARLACFPGIQPWRGTVAGDQDGLTDSTERIRRGHVADHGPTRRLGQATAHLSQKSAAMAGLYSFSTGGVKGIAPRREQVDGARGARREGGRATDQDAVWFGGRRTKAGNCSSSTGSTPHVRFWINIWKELRSVVAADLLLMTTLSLSYEQAHAGAARSGSTSAPEKRCRRRCRRMCRRSLSLTSLKKPMRLEPKSLDGIISPGTRKTLLIEWIAPGLSAHTQSQTSLHGATRAELRRRH